MSRSTKASDRPFPWPFFLLLILLTGLAGVADAQERDLASLNLEDLLNVEVTSVSKKEQRLLETPAAIYVITQDDIRRSGMTSIPELLRLAPGVNVAQIDGNMWGHYSTRFQRRVCQQAARSD